MEAMSLKKPKHPPTPPKNKKNQNNPPQTKLQEPKPQNNKNLPKSLTKLIRYYVELFKSQDFIMHIKVTAACYPALTGCVLYSVWFNSCQLDLTWI